MEIKSKPNEENVLEYTGPTSLKDIEARLLEIEHEKPMRIRKKIVGTVWYGEVEDKAGDIAYLDVEKSQLQLKRQFILDERNGWIAKSVWNVVVPIVVSIITTYLVSTLVMK